MQRYLKVKKMFESESFRNFCLRIRHNWRVLFAISAPIILLPVVLIPHDGKHHLPADDPNKKFRTAYVIILMATFWVLELIPLAITSLFPVVLFPLLSIQDAATVSKNYMKESNMIFLGSIILALSIEYCRLHVRGALRVISIFGSNPARIMLGTMIVAAAMSMWVSETSCATLLVPILSAITTAMFREEQPETIQHEEESSPIFARSRRESHVFANSALQSHLRSSTIRRRSTFTRASNASNVHSSSVYSRNAMPNGESHPVPDSTSDDATSIEDVHNMGIIMEGVVVPTTEIEAKQSKRQSSDKQPKKERDRNSIDLETQENIRKMLLFAVSYSSSIGGTATLVGTGPIKVFKELVKEYKLEYSSDFVGATFATWMGFNIPPLIINIFIVWIFLALRYMGPKQLCKGQTNSKLEKQKVKAYLRQEYKKLGPISAHEIGVGVIFLSVVVLWLLRDPQLFPGWNSLICKSSGTGDSTAAMLGVILLFILPKSWSFLKFGKSYKPEGKYEALMDWKFVSTNAPWGYVLLIGSGYAIADASQKSYLSHYIGDNLDSLRHLSDPALLIIVIFITSLITEVVSSTACASIILPVLFSVSCGLKIHPIFLTMASAVTASYAFMLPISSPPNAIIFATGQVRIPEMLVNGLFLTIVCSLILYVAILTYGDFIFHFSGYESFVNQNPKFQDCTFFNVSKAINTI